MDGKSRLSRPAGQTANQRARLVVEKLILKLIEKPNAAAAKQFVALQI